MKRLDAIVGSALAVGLAVLVGCSDGSDVNRVRVQTFKNCYLNGQVLQRAEGESKPPFSVGTVVYDFTCDGRTVKGTERVAAVAIGGTFLEPGSYEQANRFDVTIARSPPGNTTYFGENKGGGGIYGPKGLLVDADFAANP
ncbi:hypothetical protein HYV82_01740 [Candidatus Woesearchaeota archaeon]|nr:hypothetical protein [Candidatus Woesearchaeota archaeon]